MGNLQVSKARKRLRYRLFTRAAQKVNARLRGDEEDLEDIVV